MNLKDEIEKAANERDLGVFRHYESGFKAGALFTLKLAKDKGWFKRHSPECHIEYTNKPCSCGLDDVLKLVNGET